MFSFRLRLFPRFLILLILLTVIPVILVGRIVLNINNESLQYEVQRYHLRLAQSMAEKFDDRLNSITSQLAIPIQAIENPEISWLERQKLLGSLIDAFPHFAIISAVTESGEEVIKAYNPQLAPEVDANPSLVSHKNSPLFISFQRSHKQETHLSRIENNTFAEIYLPLRASDGKSSVYVKLSLTDLCEMINKETIGLSGYAYLVGRNGSILSRPAPPAGRNEDVVEDKSIVRTALQGSLGAREFNDELGRSWIGASSPLSKLGGAIVTQQPKEEAYSAISKAKRQALLFVFLTVLFAILAAFFLTRSLVRPLLSISKVAQEVDLSSGQFPEPIRISSRDEIQEMALTFNSMIDKLKGYASLQVEKLVIEQKKTEAIIFSIKDGIIMTDYQGKIQLMSYMAKKILSIPDTEPVFGQPLWKYLPSAELKTACVELLTNPENKKTIDVKLITPEEKNYFYTLTAEQVRSPGKEETLGMVTVLHDVTLEKELDSMKEEFLHSITHDLRNPLTAIRGFIRLFQSGQTGPLAPIQTKMLETMDNASLRLVNMVNDILDLARLESGRLSIHLESCRLEDISTRVIELFHPQSKTNGITINLEVQGEGANMHVDPNLIERVFTNLVSNATKFTPEGGSITVRIENRHDAVRCSVNDTGEGIPAHYLEKVFDKFQQVEGHFKGGAGLGLTICRRIVEAHEGRIWVESTVGKGASFVFTLPRDLQLRKGAEAA